MSRRTVLAGLPAGQDLWVYGHGSLLWDPGFHFVDIRQADLAGYQRRFSYRTHIVGRGSPEHPSLVLSLEEGAGACQGLVFCISAAQVEAESAILWRREMIRGGYCPVLRPVQTPQGEVTALVFAPNLAHRDHLGELPLDGTAAIIASGQGPLGTNRAYLEQVGQQLDGLGIQDDYLDHLLKLVKMIKPQDSS